MSMQERIDLWHPDYRRLIVVPGAVDELERLYRILESGITLPLPQGGRARAAITSRTVFLRLVHQALCGHGLPPITASHAMHRVAVVSFLRWLVQQRTGECAWFVPVEDLVRLNWQMAKSKPEPSISD